MELCINHLPASQERLCQYSDAQLADPVCTVIMEYCQNGWPERHKIEPSLKPYWKVQKELTIHDSLQLFQKRIVVPASLQRETLLKFHQGHQGLQICRLRAQYSVWWPDISKQIKELIEQCSECVKNCAPCCESLMPTPLPDFPWQKVAMDLFTLDGFCYLIIVDFFSRYPEVIKLRTTTSSSIIEAVKAVFSRHGIPETVLSDNGPQFSSMEFAKFASDYSFHHIPSSLHFPQSNGLAERTVQIVKNLLKGSSDPYLAILSYCSTPFPLCNLSPAQLHMGRQLRTTLPQVPDQMIPEWPYLKKFRVQDQEL